MTDEESWAKKPVLLHRQRQLDEINDLLEGCCEDADANKEICPLCKLCYRKFDELCDKSEDQLTSEDTRNMVRIILMRKRISVSLKREESLYEKSR
jgi:hypothetical protein